MKKYYEQSITKRNTENKIISSALYNYGLLSIAIPFLIAIVALMTYTFTLGQIKAVSTILPATVFLILSAVAYAKLVENRGFKTFGFINYKPSAFVPATLAAMFIFVISFTILMGAAGFPKLEFNKSITFTGIIGLIYLFLLQTLAEELIYRGIVMQSLLRLNAKMKTITNIIIAVIISSIGFTLNHSQIFSLPTNVMIPSAVGLFLAAVVMGLIAVKYGMYAAWGFHFGWNFINALIGLPVSGQKVDPQSTLFSIPSDTFKNVNTFISGGEFGLEAGYVLLACLAIAAVILFTLIQKDLKKENN